MMTQRTLAITSRITAIPIPVTSFFLSLQIFFLAPLPLDLWPLDENTVSVKRCGTVFVINATRHAFIVKWVFKKKKEIKRFLWCWCFQDPISRRCRESMGQ